VYTRAVLRGDWFVLKWRVHSRYVNAVKYPKPIDAIFSMDGFSRPSNMCYTNVLDSIISL